MVLGCGIYLQLSVPVLGAFSGVVRCLVHNHKEGGGDSRAQKIRKVDTTALIHALQLNPDLPHVHNLVRRRHHRDLHEVTQSHHC